MSSKTPSGRTAAEALDLARDEPARVHTERIVDYYTETGLDYSLWSKQFNMHFGFYRMGMNPFNLEGMLDRMNFEVLERLHLDPASPQHLLDMGCGLGASARYAVRILPNASVSGVTLVPWQVERAAALNRAAGMDGRVRVVRADYTAAPFPSGSFDGVYVVESSCYAPGSAKEPLVREMFRLLKPGKRFVVADAFLKTERWMDPLTRVCCKALCECWSLTTLGEIHRFARCLESVGFRDIRIENISKNVTPSVLHVPRPMVHFMIREFRNLCRTRHRKRWGNMMAGLFLILFALDRSRSGYFMVSGAKP